MEIKNYKPLFYGSLSGACGYISTLPLDFIKQHVQNGNTFNSIRSSLKINGYRSLYNGGLIGLQSIIPQMAIKFSTNDYLIKHTNNSKWTNGFIAGFLDGTFLGPILAIQSFRQMNSIITYKECFSLLRNNYSRFFHLPLPMAMRNAVYTSFLFGAYNPVKSILFNENKKINFLDNLLITSIVNIPAVLLCSGFDVIRAQQITKFLENKNVNSFSIAKNIFKSNGILGFYRGIGSLYINFAFRFPLTFSMYQY